MKNYSLFLALLLFNMAAQAQVANYESKTRVCSGEPFTLTSNCFSTDAYQWLIDGNSYAISQDTVAILTTPCSGNYTISLVAFNSFNGTSDTFSREISVLNATCPGESGVDYTGCYADTFTFLSHIDAVSNLWAFSEPQTIIDGCDTCDHVKFLLTANELDIYNTITYEGGCQDVIAYNHTLCPGGWLSVEEVTGGTGITIAPNPFSDRATLQFPNAGGKKYTFQLYNTEGRLVRRIDNITSGQLELGREGLSAGAYFYHLSAADATPVKGRIFIQ